MFYTIATQCVGVIAMVLLVISFQCVDCKKLFLLQSIANLFFAIHFFMLQAYTGMAMNLIGAVRCVVLQNRGKKWADSKITFYILMLLILGCGAIGFDFPISLLSIFAMAVSMVAMWTNNGNIIRLANLAAVSPCWLVYNIFAGSVPSIPGIINETVNMISIIVSIKRFGLKRLSENV